MRVRVRVRVRVRLRVGVRVGIRARVGVRVYPNPSLRAVVLLAEEARQLGERDALAVVVALGALVALDRVRLAVEPHWANGSTPRRAWPRQHNR